MAKTYSQDLRDRVLAAYDRGMETSQIAQTFAVSHAWARRVRQRRRETGRTTALTRGGATIIKIDMQRLAELVQEQPDATMLELRDRLGVECTESAICLALKRLDLTFKKRRSMRLNKIDRTSPSAGGSGRTSSPAEMLGD
jgi:transposase